MQYTPNSPTFFLYARKSSESEDQQVASIDSQIQALKALAQRNGLVVAAVFSEAQSAKAPGRPVFNQMLARLHRKEARGILCWKLDRLARNPVDGGNVSWMLQEGILQSIQTHERNYCPADNVLMMSVEFGMANQYVRDLSQNVKRGLLAKVQQGWYPGVAKPGYLNTTDHPKGERTTPRDPVRFPLLQRAFKLVLSGLHTPPQVLYKLNHEYGYRTPKRRKIGGVPLSHSGFYRILADPFYYGQFEFPRGSGNWYQGKHVPMLTEQEFWRLQTLLGKKGRPRPKQYTFAYTGLLTCGECSAAITAEVKEQTICSNCKYKFASRNRTACPQCQTPIDDMHTPTHLRYEYYHCTKRKRRCAQPSLTAEALEDQVSKLLASLTLSEPIKDWCIQKLQQEARSIAQDKRPIREALNEAHTDCKKRLSNLLQLKISPQNSDGGLLSDEEFAQQRSALRHEMEGLRQKIMYEDNDGEQWTDTAARVFDFACYAQDHFKNGKPQTKRAILSALGSNLTLCDKKLRICWHKHFILMRQLHAKEQREKGRFEPTHFRQSKRKNRGSNPAFSTWLRGWDGVRTLFTEATMQDLDIPKLTAL